MSITPEALEAARKIQNWAESLDCISTSREENILSQARMIDNAITAATARLTAELAQAEREIQLEETRRHELAKSYNADLTAIRAQLAEAEKREAGLREALAGAKETIRAWHGFKAPSQEWKAEEWKCYQHSPEMRRIDAALAQPGAAGKVLVEEKELEELRKDRERLDWLETGPILPLDASLIEGVEPEFQRMRITRAAIDRVRSPQPPA